MSQIKRIDKKPICEFAVIIFQINFSSDLETTHFYPYFYRTIYKK